ncbi:MAG: transglutaminase family protein [Candidatus Methanoplasma sp.]|jgi:transglutaminase-like putative cysteine protease|nr:transglutaminase family protein [Candidatus Methanoplasma sp.]
MEYILESNDINDYLKSDRYIDFHDISIQEKADELFFLLSDETERIKAAYEFVRDEINHSGDIGSERVTKSASEVLKYKEGICVAKSLLLAAILRYGGIPAGLCYQRLTRGDTPSAGYVIHGLNAVFLSGEERWIRLDARGNKQNIDAQFSTDKERIAFPVRVEYNEIDYPIFYATPHPLVTEALEKCINRREYEFDISAI